MHQMSSTKPLLCQELIGREHELQELGEALQSTANGKPQLVLLAGEAGLGKTKLCRTFIESSQAHGALVLFGQATSQDKALPFGIFSDAFYRYFTITTRTGSTSTDFMPPSFAFLLQILPELAPLFPGVMPVQSQTEGTTEQRRQALFHNILRGLQSLAQASAEPVLLILEDLHWADETSLELLTFLASRLETNKTSTSLTEEASSASLLILGTYRTEALPDSPALDRLLVQLRAQRRVNEIHLAPLSLTEHQGCVSSILRQPVPEEFATLLFTWDEGNPFFTEELLGAMVAAGQLQFYQGGWLIEPDTRPPLPPSLTAAIFERVRRLPATDQEVLAYAAVIGRTFDFTLLATLSSLDERQLVTILRRAMNAQLISEITSTQPMALVNTEQDRYQFRHTLTREAIYDQMLAPERRMRHRIVAEMLEKLVVDSTAPPGIAGPTKQLDNLARFMAEHYWLAGLAEKARPYALYEAERASRVFAFREEGHYLHMAQASLPQDSPERLDLLLRLGMVSLGVYDLAGALQWLNQAKIGYQRIGQPHQALRVLAQMLLPSWLLAAYPMPVLLAEVEDTAKAIFTDSSMSNDVNILVTSSQIALWWVMDGQHARATAWIERAVALFDVVTDPQKEVALQVSYLMRGWIRTHEDRVSVEAGLAEIREVLHFASLNSLPDVIILSYASLAAALIFLGRGDEARQALEELAEYGRRSGTSQYVFHVGWQHFFSGERWKEAIELLYRDIDHTEQANIPSYTAPDRIILAHFLIARNELAEAQVQLEAAQPTIELCDEYLYLAQMWWGFARLQTAQGNMQQAEVYYERLLNRWKTTGDTQLIQPILLDVVELYAETNKLLKARRWLEDLKAVVLVTGNPVGAAALLEAEGVVVAKEGAMEQAIHALRQAVEAWSKLKRPYQQTLASQRLASLLLNWARRKSTSRVARQSAREEADALLRWATAVYELLHIPIGLETVKMLRASTRLESQGKRRRTLLAHHLPHGLTPREMQVLLQLAAGSTNKEISTDLCISTSTVEVHITNIFNKLGCHTRTQAATYAIAQGWITAQMPS